MFALGSTPNTHNVGAAATDRAADDAASTKADVAEDPLKWAEEHDLAADKAASIQTLHAAASEQVERLRPCLDTSSVLSELEATFLLEPQDIVLGKDGIAKCILRTLLLMRAGQVLGSSFVSTRFTQWEEASFESYLTQKVLPLAPFRWRAMLPDVDVQRVLVLLHGMLVTGDDLLNEAAVLQRLMPETAIFLPEAPVLVDRENGLRAWWPLPTEAAGDIHEARKMGHLTAPPDVCGRLVVTVRALRQKVGDVPLILGGFSQGSQLLAQCLQALHKARLGLQGLVVLSGLVAPFEVPGGVRCLALHGGRDEKIPLALAQEAAAAMDRDHPSAFRLEVLPDLGHEVSDAELERIAGFCGEVAPVVRAVQSTAEEQAQEAEKAKLLRYVKRMSEGLSMYDKDWFMRNIVDLHMVGLGPESPTLGDGTFRYHMHKAGPDSRGLVLLFHGMVSDLRKETDALAQAYVRALKVDVCVVDYRQKTSCLNIDAQICLDSLEKLTGSTSAPVILHGTGFGATCAIHIALATQVVAGAAGRRLRLLVLDGAMGAIHMNVGCTTKDPIGNDSKLAYVRLPLCVLGGDDRLCGLTVGDTQWNQVSELAQELFQQGKIPEPAIIAEPALKHSAGDARLNPGLYNAANAALDAVPIAASANTARGKDFITDVLDVSEEFSLEKPEKDFPPWSPQRGTSPKVQLEGICQKALANTARLRGKLEEAKMQPEPQRGEQLIQCMVSCLGLALKSHGGFLPGITGVRQFEATLSAILEFHPELKDSYDQLDSSFDFRVLDKIAKERLDKIAAGALEEAGEEDEDPGGVKVDVKHVTKGGSIKISVDASATILDVRKAIMAKLKETNVNKVKLVTQAAKGTKMIPDAEPLGGRTELLMVGRALD